MKKLFKTIFVSIILTILPLYILQYIVETGLRKCNIQKYVVWNEIYQSKINAEVLIMGTSRAQLMISPRILDSILNTNSYNIGMLGWTFDMQYSRFKIYLQHNIKPKYIIQNVDLSFFSKREDLYAYKQFLPYLDDTIMLHATQNYVGKFTTTELNFPMFKYNNCFDIIAIGFVSFFGKKFHKYSYKGFQNDEKHWDSTIYKKIFEQCRTGITDTILENIKFQINEYIDFCNSNNIKLIFVFAPFYHDIYNFHTRRQEVKDLINKYSIQYNIPFFDYSNDSLSWKFSYFSNPAHLTKEGAEAYSTKLAFDLKNIIH